MRINELLSEEQLDEISLGKKIAAKAARFAQGAGDVIGGTLGGIAGAWNRGERAYQRGKNVVDPQGNPGSAGGTTTTTGTTTAGGTNATTTADPTAAAQAPAATAPAAAQAPAATAPATAAAGTNTAPAAAGTNTGGTSYDTQAGKPQSVPGNRQKGDIIRSGQNTFQYTDEPGKEWFVAGGPLQEPNPQADRYNNIQVVGGKKFISKDNAKRNLGVSERKKLKKKIVAEFHSNFLGQII
jgi:hypothetical protein